MIINNIGAHCGERGGVALGKALETNTTLTSLNLGCIVTIVIKLNH